MKQQVNRLITSIQEDDRKLFLDTFDEIVYFDGITVENKVKIILKNLIQYGFLKKDDENKASDFLNKAMSGINESDLLSVVDYIHGKSDKLFTDGVSAVGVSNVISILNNELLTDSNLFSDLIKSGDGRVLRAADLKEAIGWVACYISTDSFDPETVSFYDNGKLNKRQTLKRLLVDINECSINGAKPFQVKLKHNEKMFKKIVSIYYEKRDGFYKKKADIPNYLNVIEDLINSGLVSPSLAIKTEKSKEERILIRDLVESLKNMSDQDVNKKIDDFSSFRFYPAGSGEVDVQLKNGNKIIGMSVTTDPTTHIEQNQFFRHFLKTMVVSSLREDGVPDKDLKNYEIDVMKKGKIIKKQLHLCSFFEILNYWRDKRGYRVGDRKIIDNDEMNQLIKDGKKYTNFIFYGEINPNINPKMMDEMASHLMLSYVLNLCSMGDVEIDIRDAFNFLDQIVVSKFNGVDNTRNHIMDGVKNAVFFLNESSENKDFFRKYSEGNIYKTEREVLMDSLTALADIVYYIYQSSENNINKFREKMSDFFINDAGLSRDSFNDFYIGLINNSISSDFKKKVLNIRRAESETSKSANNFKNKIEMLSMILNATFGSDINNPNLASVKKIGGYSC